MASSESEWGRMQLLGKQQYMLRAALRHGVPMTIGVVLLIEFLTGGTLTRERVTSADFLGRTLLALAIFSASGAITAYARWRAAESLFGKRGRES